MSEQRYRAVLAVIAEGHTVTEVAARFGVSRQTMHAWLAKYEAGGLENLGDGSIAGVQGSTVKELTASRTRVLERQHRHRLRFREASSRPGHPPLPGRN